MSNNWIEKDGKNYVRVTHLLSFFKEKIDIDPLIWETKTKIGTDVHYAIEQDIKGEFNVLDDRSLSYFQSYRRWKEAQDKKGTIYEQTEQRLFDDKRLITGSFDLLTLSPDSNALTLIDFKTCYTEDNVFWPLQGAFYYQLCIYNNINVSNEVCFVKLDRKGNNPKIKIYTITSELEDIANSMRKAYFYLH